jgi:hypothetical protein
MVWEKRVRKNLPTRNSQKIFHISICVHLNVSKRFDCSSYYNITPKSRAAMTRNGFCSGPVDYALRVTYRFSFTFFALIVLSAYDIYIYIYCVVVVNGEKRIIFSF